LGQGFTVESGVRAFEWMGPPEEWLGQTILLDLDVAATEDVAIVFTHLIAYPNGVSICFEVLSRREPGEIVRDEFAGDLKLHFGAEFSDGRSGEGKTSWIIRDREEFERPWRPGRIPPDRDLDLFVLPSGVAPLQLRFAGRCWIWPLPTPGTLKVAVGWPAAGLPLRSIELDAEPILLAAAAAEPIWEDG
jgi:hypothetical protein